MALILLFFGGVLVGLALYNEEKVTNRGEFALDILMVDTDLNNFRETSESIGKAFPNDKLHSFSDPLLALKYGTNNPVSLLITAVKMRGVDGPNLTTLLRKAHPDIKVIFINQGPLQKSVDLNAMPDAVLEMPVTTEALIKVSNEWGAKR